MTSGQTYQCEFASRPSEGGSCECTALVVREGLCARRRARECDLGDSARAKRNGARPHSVAGCALISEGVEGSERWITSYVLTRLRVMAGETFAISRHTSDCLARMLHDQFIADTDCVLRRILDFSAVRNLYEGTDNVMLDDVRVALSSAASTSG